MLLYVAPHPCCIRPTSPLVPSWMLSESYSALPLVPYLREGTFFFHVSQGKVNGTGSNVLRMTWTHGIHCLQHLDCESQESGTLSSKFPSFLGWERGTLVSLWR